MAEPDVAFASLDPDATDRLQPLRRQLGVSSFGINLIVLQPRQRMRVHTHDRQEEAYLVLEGQLTLVLDAAEHQLGVGELVRVGAGTKRQLVNRGPRRLVVLALGGAGDHQSRDGRAWASWDEGGEGRHPSEVPLPEDLPSSERPDR